MMARLASTGMAKVRWRLDVCVCWGVEAEMVLSLRPGRLARLIDLVCRFLCSITRNHLLIEVKAKATI